MTCRIVWSPAARRSFDRVIEFFEAKWATALTRNLILDIDSTLRAIARNPALYPVVSSERGIRKCVIKRKTLLFYRVKDGTVELLLFIDSRQNPLKYRFGRTLD